MKEGRVVKGGQNDQPTRLRPSEPPKGQGLTKDQLELGIVERAKMADENGVLTLEFIVRVGPTTCLQRFSLPRAAAILVSSGAMNVDCLNGKQCVMVKTGKNRSRFLCWT